MSPIYGFYCDHCGAREDFVYMGIKEYDKPRACQLCQEPMKREISHHKSQPFTPYYHKGLDMHFGSRSEEKAYVKKRGLVDITGDFGKKLSDRDHTPATKHSSWQEHIQNAKRGR